MQLAELRKYEHLSASSINDYIDCGLLYKFGRVDHLPMEFKSDALEFGTIIHLVLAEFYEAKMEGEKLSLKKMQTNFENYWTETAKDNEKIRYAEGKSFETILLEGKELLTAWYNKLPDDNFKVIAVEQPFSFTIPGLSIPIIGGIDLIEEDESGCLIITDFKTAGRSYSNDETDKNFQLTIYQMAAKAIGYTDREILLKFDCLLKTKTKDFKQYWTTRTELDERRAARKIARVWDGIRKQVFVPNDMSWKCKGCAYKKACDEYLSGGDE